MPKASFVGGDPGLNLSEANRKDSEDKRPQTA